MGLDLPEVLLVLGALLTATAALSGWLHVNVLSISVLSLAAGIGLALAGVIDVEPGDDWLVVVIELALVMTLFADGLLVEEELLRERWHAPVRTLVAAMPLTLVLIGLAAKSLFPELSWAEAFLLGAVLSPTDPVVTSSVVSNMGVPASVRHTLNLESGLNDGLALPFVLFFVILSEPGGDAARSGLELAGEAFVGAAIGAALGAGAGRFLDRLPGGSMAERYEGVYALGVALLSFGLAEATIGNGLIAAFVGGIVLAVSRPEIPEAFVGFNESVSATLQVAVFVLFGALIVTTAFDASIPALAAFIVFMLLVARPAAVLLSFVGTRLPRPEKLFMAWFGPKGVASMLFALLAAESAAPHHSLVFEVASFAILASITAHGLTDTVGANWIAGKMRPASRGA
jgi:NhaP-type Na+/H+ or K+/H+ antiporter